MASTCFFAVKRAIEAARAELDIPAGYFQLGMIFIILLINRSLLKIFLLIRLFLALYFYICWSSISSLPIFKFYICTLLFQAAPFPSWIAQWLECLPAAEYASGMGSIQRAAKNLYILHRSSISLILFCIYWSSIFSWFPFRLPSNDRKNTEYVSCWTTASCFVM